MTETQNNTAELTAELENTGEGATAERRSSRLANKALLDRLDNCIEKQSNTHVYILENVLTTEDQGIEREQLIKWKQDLGAENKTVQNLYEEIKSAEDFTPSRELVQRLDRLKRDYKIIVDQIVMLLSDYSNKTHKPKNPSLVGSHASNFSPHMSLLQHSNVGSVRSSISGSSRRSHSASVLRLKVNETRANMAAKEIELRAEEEAATMEQELEELRLKQQAEIEKAKQQIAQTRRKAALEMERRKEEVYLRALQEEGDDETVVQPQPTLMLPPKQTVLTPPSGLQLPPKLPQRLQPLPDASPPNSTLSSGTPANTTNTSSDPDLVTSLTTALRKSRQPRPEPSVFGGDRTTFNRWYRKFGAWVVEQEFTALEKMDYLEKCTAGEAKEAINGYLDLDTEEAYEEALETLRRRYGNLHKSAQAFRDKLDSWPKVQSKSVADLRKFSDYLKRCNIAMKTNPGLMILNDIAEIKKIMAHLPDWLQGRWRRRAEKTFRNTGEYPPFERFSEFVAEEADLSDGALSTTAETKSTPAKQRTEEKTERARTFNTQAKAADKTASAAYPPCLCCKKTNHRITECFFLEKRPMEEKDKFVREHNLCFYCLSSTHGYKQCDGQIKCKTCKGKHATSVHSNMLKKDTNPHTPQTQAAITPDDRQTSETEQATATSHRTSACSKGTGMIVPVYVTTENKGEVKTYALLDTQSDATFISKQLNEELGDTGTDTQLHLSTMTSRDTPIATKKVSGLQARGISEDTYISLPAAYTIDLIPADLTQVPTPDTAKRWHHLRDLVDEIPKTQDCEVGLLIGYNCPSALAPLDSITGQENQPFAVRTALGWSIVGQAEPSANQETNFLTHRITTFQDQMEHKPITFHCPAKTEEVTPRDIANLMEKEFCEPPGAPMSQDDKLFLEKMETGIYQLADGHFSMPLPLKSNPQGANTRQTALKRLQLLERKFKKDPNFKTQYEQFMSDLLRHGEAEEVKPEDMNQQHTWYIPHFGVYHPKKPEKIRVVFDASARSCNGSLNDYLAQGPDHMNRLLGVLIRFREDQVAIMCDIERMFYQFRVHTEDRDYLRFLWYGQNGEVKDYRMTVHIFGAVSSPACATYGLRHLANTLQDKTDPMSQKAAGFIMQDFYVDDGLTSVSTTEEAQQLIASATELCEKGGVRLHKFASNNKKLLASIAEEEKAKSLMDLNFSKEALPVERALGVQWSMELDTFQFRITINEKPWTRRGLLATIASVFDPLGFLAPFILVGKQILQDMCKNNTDWDEPLPDDLMKRWDEWRHNLSLLDQIRIQRCLMPPDFENIHTIQLHHFSDASNKGYGQCSYLRVCDSEKGVHCALVAGKSRVMPLKAISIPRAELQAAVLSAKMAAMIREEIRMTPEEFFWTDSQVVLAYINNDVRRFHIFVANRIQKIKDQTAPGDWRHVPTEQNPADHASRGLLVKELTKKDWFEGPNFLHKADIDDELNQQPEKGLSSSDPEVRCTINKIDTYESKPIIDSLNGLSTWTSVISAITLLRGYIRKRLGRPEVDIITARQETEKFLIKEVQRKYFSNEIQDLEQNQPIKNTSPVYKLDPVVDDEGLLRVGGRLRHGVELTAGEKHPMLLPKRHHITDLLIRHQHAKVYHQGKGITMAKLRSSGYWIVNLGSEVSRVIRECVLCRKLRALPQQQKMADLPQERLSQTPPFTFVGADCFGPFTVKEGRRELKRYGIVFTCLYSRAIHIEVLDDMTTDCFLNSLRNLIAIRGPVRQIRTDRGTNFVGAQGEWRKALENMANTESRKFQIEHNCEFTTNVPHASHMGGVWERQIRTIRSVLQGILQQHSTRLDTSALRTLLYEVMSIVNSRPLGSMLDEPSVVLSPNMILTMKSDVVLPPPGDIEDSDVYSRKRWLRVQALSNLFWRRWKNEYMTNLQKRQKWTKPSRNIQPNDIVLVEDDTVPRGQWPLGKVTETTDTKDGLVRSAKIQLSDKKIISRPIHKLVFIK